MTETSITGLDLVRRLGVCRVARALGISSQAVSGWKQVPANRCAEIAAAFPRRASRARLRPDLFGKATADSIDQGRAAA